MKDLKKILIEKVNNSNWWHVPPADPDAYKKRGKFLASTYTQAEFYGRPNIQPEKVRIKNPLFGFSDKDVLKKLFGQRSTKLLMKEISIKDTYKAIIELDAKMCRRARYLNYDAIVLMAKSGKNFLRKGIKPKSIELNLMNTAGFAKKRKCALNLC